MLKLDQTGQLAAQNWEPEGPEEAEFNLWGCGLKHVRSDRGLISHMFKGHLVEQLPRPGARSNAQGFVVHPGGGSITLELGGLDKIATEQNLRTPKCHQM